MSGDGIAAETVAFVFWALGHRTRSVLMWKSSFLEVLCTKSSALAWLYTPKARSFQMAGSSSIILAVPRQSSFMPYAIMQI